MFCSGSFRPTLLAALLLITTDAAFGASYRRTDGTLVDPILDGGGAVHAYAGPNLEPGAEIDGALQDLSNADLRLADLMDAVFIVDFRGADLTGANLEGASFCTSGCSPHWNPSHISGARFAGANLRGVRFDFMSFANVDLAGADLRGASLYHADALGSVLGSPIYDATTNFGAATVGYWEGYDLDFERFDPVAAGWTFVPEPETALLLGLGLAALPRKRRA